jgi:hypothetical protein
MKAFLIALGCVALAGCAVEPGGEEQVESMESSASVGTATWPQGMACGMIHTDYAPHASCNGYRTRDQLHPQYAKAEVGDYGLSAGHGFVTQTRASSAGDVSDTKTLNLPRGTVCGLWHHNGDFKPQNGQPCMGTWQHQRRSAFGSTYTSLCPEGFALKYADDRNAPQYAGFAWCEYQDPNGRCNFGECDRLVPVGTICGLRDSDYAPAQQSYCRGYGGNQCPNGWYFRGFFDAGRSAGHGLGWCEKA